jgi:hypothetical protein
MAKSERGGNFVSEWFGQRIYPNVRLDIAAVSGSGFGQCPFLGDVLKARTPCVKNTNSAGVCSISSVSNGSRQDWLVCPYRVISSDIVSKGCQRIFELDHEVTPLPVSVLQNEGALRDFVDRVRSDGSGYLFFQDKLGGEISLPGTARSPELSFDITLVEIRPDGPDGFSVSRYGILEIQTMDYHGSYKSAVNNLRDGLRLHGKAFPAALETNLSRWAGEGIEGPNVANVFKRTFYQMMLKFRMAGQGSAAAGIVLALPRSVWDSWQPFLGAPEVEEESTGIMRLHVLPGTASEPPLNAFICVFDLDSGDDKAVSPVRIEHFIRVSPEKLTHHAFTVVPAHILQSLQTDESVLARIRVRLGVWWPAFHKRPARRRR